MKKMTICLTGGIASGKTLASDQMEKAGFEIIDADIIARQVVQKGSRALSLLVDAFGSHILTSSGNLNRRQLKEIVFKNDQMLQKLNLILHPRISKSIDDKLTNSQSAFVVLVIPLLNTDMIEKYSVDRVLVIDVKPGLQWQRVMSRDLVSEKIATKIISSQMDRKDRLYLGDDIVSNNDELSDFQEKVDQVIKFYKSWVLVKNSWCKVKP